MEYNQQPNQEPVTVVQNKESSSGKAWLWVLVIIIVAVLLFVLFAKNDVAEESLNDAFLPQVTEPTNPPPSGSSDASEAAQIEAELQQTEVEGMSEAF